MIQSRPKLKSKKLIITSLFLIASTVLIIPLSPLAAKYAFVLQLVALASASVSLFLLTKYVIPDYLYTLEDGHFIIHKINRSRSVCVADIEISDIISDILNAEQYKKRDEVYKKYTFIKNPGDADIRYIICNFGADSCVIIFEPDKNFEENFKLQLEEYKNSIITDDEDEDDD